MYKDTHSGEPGFGNSHGNKDSDDDYAIKLLDEDSSVNELTYATIKIPCPDENRNKFSRGIFMQPSTKVSHTALRSRSPQAFHITPFVRSRELDQILRRVFVVTNCPMGFDEQ